jgi:tetratricopeptide repeat protein
VPQSEEVIRLVPEDPVVYSMLGASNLKTGSYEGGREAFIQAIRIKPDFVGAHYGLGLSYVLHSEYDKRNLVTFHFWLVVETFHSVPSSTFSTLRAANRQQGMVP